MTIVVINPNRTGAMTRAMVAVARDAVPSAAFEGWTSREGPPAIQGAADGEAATPPLLALVEEAGRQGARGIVIGCFDDTGLADAALRVDVPVIGIGQAAYHLCAMRQRRFGVVTTLAASVPVLEDNIARHGLSRYLGRVRASNVPVLALDRDPDAAAAPIVAEARAAVNEDGIDALILGCAGMGAVQDAVARAVAVEVVDPVRAAASCIAWLVEADRRAAAE